MIKVCRFEIIDGVKYVYCIKHAYKFLLSEQVRSRVCGRSLTLAPMGFLMAFIRERLSISYNVTYSIQTLPDTNTIGLFVSMYIKS